LANINKKVFVSSAAWKMVESLSTRGVSLLISILLARLLLPEDYGIVALTAIFINLSSSLVASGLGTALVRKEDVDNVDYTTVFIFCMIVAAVLYVVCFFAAPFIADFYEEPMIKPVLRVQMLSLFLCALGVVRGAMITRQFQFKAQFITNFIATVIGGVTGIVMAYAGLGVWALVFYTLIQSGSYSFILFFFVKWKPSKELSFKRMKSLLSFSSFVLFAGVLDFLGNNIPGTVYGKHYSVEVLGYTSKGGQLPELICLHTFGAISGVLLPAMAETQSDLPRLKAMTRKIASMSAFILIPMMIGLAFVGERTIIFLFTEKWLPAAPFLITSCIYYLMNPFRSINMQLIYALGDSKKATMVEIIRFCLLMANMLLGVFVFRFSLITVSYISSGVAIVVVLITQAIVKRYIGYSYREWFSDIAAPLMMSVAMAAVVYLVGLLQMSNLLVLILQVATGVVVYFTLAVITKNPCLAEALGILKGMIKR